MPLCNFQHYDPNWEESVDLDINDAINNKDKLKAVVAPILEEETVLSSLGQTPSSSVIDESLEEETPVIGAPVWNTCSTPVEVTLKHHDKVHLHNKKRKRIIIESDEDMPMVVNNASDRSGKDDESICSDVTICRALGL